MEISPGLVSGRGGGVRVVVWFPHPETRLVSKLRFLFWQWRPEFGKAQESLGLVARLLVGFSRRWYTSFSSLWNGKNIPSLACSTAVKLYVLETLQGAKWCSSRGTHPRLALGKAFWEQPVSAANGICPTVFVGSWNLCSLVIDVGT